jgi:antitoxin component YwqK of YwqJK toxin-antitoxin module
VLAAKKPMTRTSILFLVTIIFLSCNKPKEVVLSRFANGNVREQFVFDNSSTKDTTGLFKSFFIDGKLEVVGRLKNGKRDGDWTQYNSEGNIIWKGTFNNEVLNGEVFDKDKNGSWDKTNYVNGIKEGKSIEFIAWRSNQNKMRFYYQVGQYNNNKPQGLWIRKDTNGVILAENTFVDGVIRGYFTNRYENGNIKLKGELNIDSAGHNKFDFYDTTGKKTKLNSYQIDLVEP